MLSLGTVAFLSGMSSPSSSSGGDPDSMCSPIQGAGWIQLKSRWTPQKQSAVSRGHRKRLLKVGGVWSHVHQGGCCGAVGQQSLLISSRHCSGSSLRSYFIGVHGHSIWLWSCHRKVVPTAHCCLAMCLSCPDAHTVMGFHSGYFLSWSPSSLPSSLSFSIHRILYWKQDTGPNLNNQHCQYCPSFGRRLRYLRCAHFSCHGQCTRSHRCCRKAGFPRQLMLASSSGGVGGRLVGGALHNSPNALLPWKLECSRPPWMPSRHVWGLAEPGGKNCSLPPGPFFRATCLCLPELT